VVSGHASPIEWSAETTRQYTLARRSAARMAADYGDEGFAAVIDDVVGEDDVDQLTAHLAGRPLNKVVLIPRLDVVLTRNRTRTNKTFDTGILEPVARRLHRSLADGCRPSDGWIALDTSELDVEATVTELFRRVGRDLSPDTRID
jgi:hypothetical protein